MIPSGETGTAFPCSLTLVSSYWHFHRRDVYHSHMFFSNVSCVCRLEVRLRESVTIFESYNTSVFVVVVAAAQVNPCRHFSFFQFYNIKILQDTFSFLRRATCRNY